MWYYYIGGKMEKMTNKKILNLVSVCILLIVPFLKFFSMNLEMFKIIRNYDYVNPAIILYISVPFLLFIYIKDIINSKRKLDIYDYLFYILTIVGVISVIFSIDKNLAIFGKGLRHEGFLSILSYYLLFINWKVNGTKEDIKKFIKFLIILAIINSIYSLLQIYTDFSFILRYENDIKMASGLCGNPNFFGSLIVTVISIIICKFMIDKKISIKDILIIILLFIALINSQSTGPFLTLIITILFLIVFLYIKKQLILKKFLVLIIILITTYASIYFINKNVYKSDRCEMCIEDIKQTINNGGNGRLGIWENSLGIVKDNWLIGVGFDNFYLAYPNPKVNNAISLVATGGKLEAQTNYYYIVDNAHNVYLHTLVSTGILGLIPYLLLCLFAFIKGLKFKSKLGVLLLSGFVAYSIQAFANISVIQVAPIYYIIIGLILSIKE